MPPYDALCSALPCPVPLQWSRWRESRRSARLPDLLWQQKKRLMGPPRAGVISVVVTDIQDYTRLTNEAPEDVAQVGMVSERNIC